MPSNVLITGASSGIGEFTAYAFSKRNARLFLVARRQERLARVAQACSGNGAAAVSCRSCDLSLPGQGETIVQECIRDLGGLDVLICNAGYGIYGRIADIPPQDMARIWQVNYQSGYESIHAALPHLLSQDHGHIVLVSSIIGKKAFPYSSTYCATKFAQVGLAEGLWGELRGTGVGVSVICPGYTATEFQKSAQATPEMKSMRRIGSGQDPAVVADAIVKAVERRKREVHLTFAGKALLFVNRIVPNLTALALAWGTEKRKR